MKRYRGKVIKHHVPVPTIINSASLIFLYFDWPVEREAVRKLSAIIAYAVTKIYIIV